MNTMLEKEKMLVHAQTKPNPPPPPLPQIKIQSSVEKGENPGNHHFLVFLQFCLPISKQISVLPIHFYTPANEVCGKYTGIRLSGGRSFRIILSGQLLLQFKFNSLDTW